MTRGRPLSSCHSVEVRVHLRLDPQLDADVIAFFSSIEKGQRANVLKAALRAGGIQSAGQFNSLDDEVSDPLDNLLL